MKFCYEGSEIIDVIIRNNVTPHFYLCKHASCSTVGLSVIVTYVTSQMLLEN